MKKSDMRECEISRKTAETDIRLSLNIDGAGAYKIDTGCAFLDHMLELFALHGCFDIELGCVGDTRVDYHHTTEDVAIVLGAAFREAAGDMRGTRRYGDILLPMDEALVLAAADVSGRGFSCCDLRLPTEKVGDFDTELAAEFFAAFCRSASVTLHLRKIAGSNSHHIIEAAFKAAARALKTAYSADGAAPSRIPSTKGIL